ncbi:hypothetical protein JTB14_023543 [Gonioctena quinquepunctata]|nr:hypothetical protein JTB14_023543 [Gonioctena quinquepunctata]
MRSEKNYGGGSWGVHDNSTPPSIYKAISVAFNDETLLDQPGDSRSSSTHDAGDDSASSQFDDSDADKDYSLSSESCSDLSSTSSEEITNQAEMKKQNIIEENTKSRKRRANLSRWKKIKSSYETVDEKIKQRKII